MGIIIYIIPFIKKIRIRLVSGIIFSSLSIAISLMIPTLVGKFISRLSSCYSLQDFLPSLITLALLWLLSILVSYINTMNRSHMSVILSFEINHHLLNHIQNLPYEKLLKWDTAYITNRINCDSNVLASFFLDFLFGSIFNLFSCVIAIVNICTYNPRICMFLSLIIPIYVLIYWRFNERITNISKEMMESRDILFRKMHQQLRFIRSIKLNSWHDQLNSKLIYCFRQAYHNIMNHMHIGLLYSSCIQLIRVMANIYVFFSCSIAIVNGSMKLGDLITVNSLFSIAFSSFIGIMDFGKEYANALASLSRVKEYEVIEEQQNGAIPLDRIDSIELKEITFQYDKEETPILQSCSANFESGCIYQVHGENGCGKSTLINALLGLLSCSGSILYNKIPIEMLDMESVRRNAISVVEQEPPLIFETIYENVLNDNSSESEINNKISTNGLLSFIGNRLWINRGSVDGLSGLSGGEKQKIAILRAILKEHSLLILDEPASALDTESIDVLKQILIDQKVQHITILIDHQNAFSDIVDVNYTLQSNHLILSEYTETNEDL